MACPSMQIERQLAKTLPQVQSYRIQGRHLELLDSEGNASCAPKSAPAMPTPPNTEHFAAGKQPKRPSEYCFRRPAL